jgi:glycerol kinase
VKEKYILALDQGTTSSRAILFNHKGKAVASAQKEFSQYFPKPGWVEHSPVEIWSSQISVATEAIAKLGISPSFIDCIGITNQRETSIVWDRKTGKPIYNAIVWQDHRTAAFCEQLKEKGYGELIKQKTGLEIDPYFSATKINWILENVQDAKQKVKNGELAFGTVDTWLLWNLTQGKKHLTDVSNASRTMLFNIHTLEWDEELLELFGIPKNILPQVLDNDEINLDTSGNIFHYKIPIKAIAGDQQAALFGQLCMEEGMVKNTYGTGCFLMMNTGHKPVFSNSRLITTIAWRINKQTIYALEGSVFIAGAAIQWLRDGLQIIKKSSDVEKLAKMVEDNGGVYFVPAFSGLGAPHWKPEAHGLLTGLTRGTGNAHIARAAIESIAFQSNDVIRAMEEDTGRKVEKMRVDGGASANNLLLQIQADISGLAIERNEIKETTALGVAYMAGLNSRFWKNIEQLQSQRKMQLEFFPDMPGKTKSVLLENWKKAISKSY